MAHVTGFRRHITDLEVRVERVVGHGNRVMAWWSFTGTHAGPWLGHPPTNAPVDGTVFSCFDLRDGRIARYRLWLHAAFVDGAIVLDTSRLDD